MGGEDERLRERLKSAGDMNSNGATTKSSIESAKLPSSDDRLSQVGEAPSISGAFGGVKIASSEV
jgi:hypothetical protein